METNDQINTVPTTSTGGVPTPAPTLTRGIVIGLLVIVLIILVCALYVWGSMISRDIEAPINFEAPINNEPETPRADADVEILRTMSSSDEVASIEADLESTNLDSLDKELDLIDSDLKQ